MTSILLIESNGTIKASKVKDVNFENLYKKGGFRSPNNFEKRTTWNVSIKDEVISIDLWAKNDGKANSENKYDFPPPVDKDLYFGTCVLVRVDEHDKIIDLTTELWAKIYERLFGGFEDLTSDAGANGDASEAEEAEDIIEEASIPKSMKTKHGYVKDGFVVDDKKDKNKKRGRKDSVSSASESEDEDYNEDAGSDNSLLSQSSDDSYDSEEDEDYEPTKKDVSDEDDEDNIDIDGSELEEECYEYSDDEGERSSP